MEPHVLVLPKWLLVIRFLQGLLALVILGVSAYGIYWVSFGAWCFALFTALATFIVLLYVLLTAHLASLKSAYNYWAVLGLEIFMVVFWLSSMAALAALRATFVIPVSISSCTNYGIGSSVCYKKRELQKRAVATYGYLNMMAGAAGVSAILMILFIVTLTVFSIHLRRYRDSREPSTAPVTNDKLEAHPMNPVGYNSSTPQQPQQPQPQQAYTQPQYASPPTQYTPTPPPQQPYSPPPQQQPYYPPPLNQHPIDPNQQYHEAPTPNQQHPNSPAGQVHQ